MICIYHPSGYTAERFYILNVIFDKFLGIKCRYIEHLSPDIRIVVSGSSGELLLPDTFFQTREADWLRPVSLPKSSLAKWDTRQLDFPIPLVDPVLPVVYGNAIPSAQDYESGRLSLPIDIIGSAFFMLTRYEEVVKTERDEHGRFPAKASLAFQEGFLERPLVDEYVEVLWAAIKHLWPGLKRKERQFAVSLSHDVDHPFGAKGQSAVRVLKALGGDVLRRRNIRLAGHRLAAAIMPGERGYRLDPNNSFDWLMDQAEKRGLKTAFYFMTGKTSAFDPGYDISAPQIVRLMHRIHGRGHEIGLHPSYGTLEHPELLKNEADSLRAAMVRAGIDQRGIGGRQHYLRWVADKTWGGCEAAGLVHDNTVGYAQHAGFRAGTCHEYPVWLLHERRSLGLVERPLVAMDGTVFRSDYMGLDTEGAIRKLCQLASACRKVSGSFTFLWHNDFHLHHASRDFYTQTLDQIA